jgi:ribosomal protein S18 acetylase RimI-like enzyme
MSLDLLRRIDAYLDAVPRAAARVEDIGPLRLFVKTQAEGWPYYARPVPGAGEITSDQVARMRERQRELGVPEAFEWVTELVPSFADAAEGSGLGILVHPLLAASADALRPVSTPSGATVRLATIEDDLARVAAVAMAGFDVPGSQVGGDSPQAVERHEGTISDETRAYKRRRLERGVTVPAIAELQGRIVAVGFHQPAGTVSEIVGVATLPAFRRRGLGAAITSVLAADALARGVDTVVLSAGDDAVARVYERVGFQRVGHAGSAEPPAS